MLTNLMFVTFNDALEPVCSKNLILSMLLTPNKATLRDVNRFREYFSYLHYLASTDGCSSEQSQRRLTGGKQFRNPGILIRLCRHVKFFPILSLSKFEDLLRQKMAVTLDIAMPAVFQYLPYLAD